MIATDFIVLFTSNDFFFHYSESMFVMNMAVVYLFHLMCRCLWVVWCANVVTKCFFRSFTLVCMCTYVPHSYSICVYIDIYLV